MKNILKSLFVQLSIVLGCFCLSSESAYAATECNAVEYYATDDGIVVYVEGIKGEVEEIQCQIESETVEIADIFDLKNSTIYTMIVWDVHTLNTEGELEQQKQILTEIIANRASDEWFCILTMGEKFSYVAKPTTDYLDLKKAVNELDVIEIETDIITSLGEAFEELEREEKECFKRIVWVTDNNRILEEPSLLEEYEDILDDISYPVYMIVCEEESDDLVQESENLFVIEAFGKSAFDVTECFSESYDVLAIKMEFPKGTEEKNKKTVQLRIETAQDTYRAKCKVEFNQEQMSLIRGKEVFGIQYELLILWGTLGVGCLVLVLLLLIFIRKKKKRKKIDNESLAQEEKKASYKEFASTEVDITVMHRVKLTNRADVVKSYQCGFKGIVIIGRNPNMCTLLISGDNSVSGRHCGIYVRQGMFFIKDLESSNGTKVNGVQVFNEVEVHTGDIVKLGRTEYMLSLE